MSESMLEIVRFLSGIRKEQETAVGVLTGQFGTTNTSSSQHKGSKVDSTSCVRWCLPVSFLCLKWFFSVHSVLCFFADVRRGCCTAACSSIRTTVVACFGIE